ncbi:MAG: penicillin-binding protein activator LpoB [Treponema sp.]|nr:penicillin-binding protein activator LpoB [Treponema sp.]
MNKRFFVTGIMICILAFASESANAQMVSLERAINSASEELSENLKSGSNIAILSMRSGSAKMSNYLFEELTSSIVSRRMFTVVDRAQLTLIREEMNFQMSGEVSEESAQAIGQKLGAQYIVTGALEPIGNYYRFRIRVIEVETAAIHVTYSADVRNDQIVTYLLGSSGVPTSAVSWGNQDFTAGERWATFGLNWLIPGLGSYVIMKDKVGGTVLLISGGIGTIGYTVGYLVMMADDYETGTAIALVSLGILGASGIYNIVRSSTYHKPQTRRASLIDPEAWNIAVLPGKDGIEQVSLSYTLRF